jgi:hypothetical protein
MALLHGVIVMVAVVHAMRLTNLVARHVMRRVMIIGLGGKRRHEGGAQHEQAEKTRTRASYASGGVVSHAVLP